MDESISRVTDGVTSNDTGTDKLLRHENISQVSIAYNVMSNATFDGVTEFVDLKT